MNLADKGELVGFLRKHGLGADKSLGQHFLAAPSVVQAIVKAAEPYEGCLEIGPGPGILTCQLVKRAKKMVAIEFDARMESLLALSTPGCEVIIGDAMQIDLAAVLKTLPEPRALVSNLPYYITGPLLERFAQVRSEYSVSVLMMQKEVGQKIIALPSDRARGSLSVHLQSQFKISHVVSASAGCFLPPPKVDSIVLKFVPRTDQFPIYFSRVVKAGFTQNRKTLINNLSATFRQTKTDIESILSECGLSVTSRAFELCESDWIRLATEVEKQPWIESVAKNSKN